MKTVYHYCTCNGKRKKETGKDATCFREVEVDRDGVCLDCGYYSISLPKKAKSRSEMYSILRINKEDESNYYLGESLVYDIIESHKEVEEKKGKINNRIF